MTASTQKVTTEIVEREYLRPADVIRATGCSKSFVMQAIWSGKLRAHQIGRAWLIPRDALREWIEGNEAA